MAKPITSELILITGASMSGKTFIANCILAKWKSVGKIWDEPDLTDRKTLKEIKHFLRYSGRAIIVMITPPSAPIMDFPLPDQTIICYRKDV